MDVSYKKDLHHNYLVIPKIDDSNEEAYCVYMLEANFIEGIIRPEPRTIDNRVLYYYDITSKQSIETIYIKSTVGHEQLRGLFTDLADLIEQAYEYLLNENDLILEPKHIYMELASCQIYVGYLPGYNRDIRKQMATLIEYLMNKVEYNDKEAVLYVYNLYAVCREQGFCFDNLLSVIRESRRDSTKTEGRGRPPLSQEKGSERNIKQELANCTNRPEGMPEEQRRKRQIPVMMEKVPEEREEYYYPLRAYVYSGACILGAIMVLVGCINMRIVYSSLGNRIDYGKLMALLLILIIAVGYLMKIIWNRNNRLTRIKSTHEYVDPRIEYGIMSSPIVKTDLVKAEYDCPLEEGSQKNLSQPVDKSNDTIVLNARSSSGTCYLEPKDKDAYDMIQIRDYPFVIGKLRSNVDYCLDNEVVSRYHVKITREEERYYITDLNSTNGTTINDSSLSCYQRHELTKGDRVSLAGIEYLFLI